MLRKLEEKVETLVKAGLTLNQAKLYLALAEAGQMTACELAQYTGVARQDIYRVVSELQKTGLVERRLSRPAVFAAAPVEQVLVKLIELRAREYETLRQKIHALLEQLKETSLTRQKPTPDMQFTVIAGKQAILNRLKKAAYEAEKSIDVVTSRTRFSLAIVEFASAYIKALQKGVRIHIAVDKHTPTGDAVVITNELQKNPYFTVRYFNGTPQAVLAIIDEKLASVTLSESADQPEAQALWSNHPCFVALARAYFQSKWSEGGA